MTKTKSLRSKIDVPSKEDVKQIRSHYHRPEDEVTVWQAVLEFIICLAVWGAVLGAYIYFN